MKPIPTWDTQYVEGGILTMASHMQQEIEALRKRLKIIEKSTQQINHPALVSNLMRICNLSKQDAKDIADKVITYENFSD